MKVGDLLKKLSANLEYGPIRGGAYNAVEELVKEYETLKVKDEILSKKLQEFVVKDEIDEMIKKELLEEAKEIRNNIVKVEIELRKVKELLGRVDV